MMSMKLAGIKFQADRFHFLLSTWPSGSSSKKGPKLVVSFRFYAEFIIFEAFPDDFSDWARFTISFSCPAGES